MSLRGALLLAALTATPTCVRDDPGAAARASAAASASAAAVAASGAAARPGVPADDPSRLAGSVVVDLVPAFESFEVAEPASVWVNRDRSSWTPEGPARIDELFAAGGRYEIRVAGPYLVDPVRFSFPGLTTGARIAVAVVPYGPSPDEGSMGSKFMTTPEAPETVLDLDLTRADTIGVEWRQASTVVEVSELPRGAPDFAPIFRRGWETHGSHRDPADPKADQAFLRVERAATPTSIAPVVNALLAIRRERTAAPGVQAPVFKIVVTPPKAARKPILDDEIIPLDVVGGAADHGAAIAGAADPMRAAIAKCGAAACSPALHARLLLHLGEALAASGRREEAELAFFDARVVDPVAALDPTATPESAKLFEAARRRRIPAGLRAGDMKVEGRLPLGVIQAGIASREGLLRLCYVQGLRRNPKLAGRISLRLVIGSDGVASGGNGGSDVYDAATIACVVGVFRNLVFPRPASGVVVVEHTILLSP